MSKENESDIPRRPEFAGRRLNFEIRGAKMRPFSDAYHILMRGTWWQLILFCFGSYVILIGGFALLFLLGGDCVENAQAGSISDMFWFSVQTFSTIGYGGMAPKTIYAHALVTLESFVGLSAVALGTALLFTRFSRPVSRVIFSDKIVIHERDGVPTLQLRIVNERANYIFEAGVRLGMLCEDVSAEGVVSRRMVELELVRSSSPIFAMTWSLFHVIDENSPLYGVSPETVHDRVLLINATFTGTDDKLVQPLYTQRFYLAEDIAFDKRFADIITLTDGDTIVDLSKLHDVEDV